MNKIDLQNRKAVITGGAQGIGLAIAERLLMSGASVSLWDRDETLVKKTANTLVSKGNVEKYIQLTKNVIDEFGVDMYTKQRVYWTSDSVDSLFNNDSVTVMTLEDFL